METLQVCDAGHAWDRDVSGICPLCAAAAELLSDETADLAETPYTDELPPAPASPPFDTILVSTTGASTMAPARRIGHYAILEEIGRGGMGVVYRAEDVRLNRVVALKMIRSGAAASTKEFARFRIEAEAIARLQHPGIVQVFEVGEADGSPFVALEFVEGGSLSKALEHSPLEPQAAAELLESLARSIQHAHEQGIIHRDLKPANILLSSESGIWNAELKNDPEMTRRSSSFRIPSTEFRIPKITDFGLARRLDTPGQTRSGEIMGTPSYMAPEQASGSNSTIGPSADIFSLGAVLYECLTGRPPFVGANLHATLMQVVSAEPVPPSRLAPGIPRDLETICLKCLRKEPRRRYASAGELADDLRRFLDGRPVTARRTPWYEQLAKWARRRPAAAALLLVSLLAVAGGVFLVVQHNRELASERNAAVNAKIDADNARIRAVNARLDADHQRDRAEENLDEAVNAIDQLLRRFGLERLAGVAHMDKVRGELLEDALAFLDRLSASHAKDQRLRSMHAHTLERAATIQMVLGRDKDARERFDRALGVIGKLREANGESDAFALRIEAMTHNNLSIMLKQQGKLDEARVELEKSLKLRERLAELDNNSRVSRHEIALSYLNFALLDHVARRKTDFQLNLQRALNRAEELAKESDDFQTIYLLVMVLDHQAVFHIEDDNFNEAKPLLERCVGLWKNLRTIAPGDIDVRENLGRCLANFGLTLRWLGYRKQAGAISRESAAIREELAANHSNIRRFHTAVYNSWFEIGENHAVAKEYETAIEWETKAIDGLKALMEDGTIDITEQSKMVEMRVSRAAAAERLGRRGDVLKDLDAAIKLAHGTRRVEIRMSRAVVLAQADKVDVALAEANELLKANPEVTGIAFYHAGRVFGVAASVETDAKQREAHAQRAIELFGHAFREGFFKKRYMVEFLKTDPAVKSLQDRPDFKAFLQRLGS